MSFLLYTALTLAAPQVAAGGDAFTAVEFRGATPSGRRVCAASEVEGAVTTGKVSRRAARRALAERGCRVTPTEAVRRSR